MHEQCLRHTITAETSARDTWLEKLKPTWNLIVSTFTLFSTLPFITSQYILDIFVCLFVYLFV